MSGKKLRITFNSPFVLSFALACTLVMLLGLLTGESTTATLFSTYGASWRDPLTYVRLFTHVLGHAGLIHLINNMAYILLLGPQLEEKYGWKVLLIVILATALVTGIVHSIFSPRTMLLGASGVVFAFILLASITGKENGIPITLILVAVLYLGQEIYNGFIASDNISQLTHIIGGLSGTVLGLIYKKK